MAETPAPTFISLWNYLWAHWYSVGTTLTIFAQFFGSWLVSSMDMPTDQDSRSYRFWFRTFNYFAGNKARAAAAAVPGPEDTIRKQTTTTTEKQVTQTVIPKEHIEEMLDKKKDK